MAIQDPGSGGQHAVTVPARVEAPPPDPLQALLHRCHRDELDPLARLLRIDPTEMGLGDLARNCARGLRRLGAHQLANAALRGGEGPPYLELLNRLAASRGVDTYEIAREGGEEALELAVLRGHFRESWGKLDEAGRTRIWNDLGLAAPAPETGDDAVEGANARLGRSFGYQLSQVLQEQSGATGLAVLGFFALHPLGCLLRMVLFPFLPVIAWWALRGDERRFLAGALEVARLRQIVLHRVTIGVVGSPSTGKDAAIHALFGVHTGNISPIAGSTKEVTIQRLPGATAMYVVNTPGLGDVVEKVTEAARQVLDHIDLYLYLINAEGGVQARELADYRSCVATGKPVLAIINKVDVLRPRDRDIYLADAREKLGAPAEDFVAVAFDPLPQLAPGPINREAVSRWLIDHLTELGKDASELPPLPEIQARG